MIRVRTWMKFVDRLGNLALNDDSKINMGRKIVRMA